LGFPSLAVRAVATFFVIQGNDQGSTYELSSDRVSIGRDAQSTIQLHDQEVSRNHAELRREGVQYTLADLGSSNGTYVNRVRVQTHSLASGDHVQMGKTLMLFTASPAEAPHSAQAKVDIVGAGLAEDNSRIVRTMSQEASRRLLGLDAGSGDTEWMTRARSHLEIVYKTALAVSRTVDIEQLLRRILRLIFQCLDADRGCVLLVDPESRRLEVKVQESRQGPGERMRISRTILDYVLERREGVLTTNAQDDSRWNPAASIVAQGIREAICVPMLGRYDVVGLIYVDTATPPQRLLDPSRSPNKFTEEHLKLMIAIAQQAALAVEDTRYYSAMVQAERLAAMGQTIATLSHHIKNILQGIRGGSFLIKDGLARQDASMVQKGWEFVEKNQERISDLVMDMLTFSKEREPEIAPGDLNRVVAEVVELMQGRAGESGVALRFEPDATMSTLTFDAEGIHRAALNVVTNAIDACAEQETRAVTVRTSFAAQENVARISVQDTGSGISPEDLRKIFNPFVSTKRSRGTGLGLAVSQKILQEHGGRIAVQSAPGAGSTFTLELPATPPPPREPPPEGLGPSSETLAGQPQLRNAPDAPTQSS
jgi:signal transduction histidine kinase